MVREDRNTTTVSQLLIRDVESVDQGIYQCRPDKHQPAETRLFIVPAVSDATRVSGAGSPAQPLTPLVSLIVLVGSWTRTNCIICTN